MRWPLSGHLPLALLVSGLVLTAALASLAWNKARDQQESEFAIEAGLIRDDLIGRLNTADAVIVGLATLVNSATNVDADQFRVFSDDVLQRHPFILSSAFLPMVTNAERPDFERERRRTGFSTFSINERHASGYRPAPDRSTYFTILFQEPFEPSTAVMIGFDVGSDPDLSAAVGSAIDSGVATSGRPLLLDGRWLGFWLFKAVYAGKGVPDKLADRRRSANGLVALRIRGDGLLPVAARTESLGLRLVMDSPGSTQTNEVMRSRNWRDGSIEGMLTRSLPVGAGGLQLKLDVQRAIRWRDIDYTAVAAALTVGGLATVMFTLSALQAARYGRELAERYREIELARQLAESANRSKTDFVANMSHEIRTPLNAIVGLSVLARDAFITPAVRDDYLGKIHAASQTLLEIIADILDVSKIESGALQLERIEFDPRQELARVERMQGDMAIEKGHAFSVKTEPEVPAVLVGDPLRVRQIITNFVANAIKFTVRGSVAVRLSAPSPGRVRIEVSDSGVGIDEPTRKRLFQPFAQADSSTTRRYGGTGLGLALCRRLVEMMDGTIGVESTLGAGSLFWAELSLPAGDLASPGRVNAAVDTAPTRSLEGVRVLLVEDNEVNRIVAVASLERLGAQATSVESGVAAIEYIDRHGNDVDVVLMDIQMPGMDGY
uniref:ATP-binding protein n=1 Tax=Roseateles sp. TaxID=1971397 RepID=UPI00286C9EB2